jgi:simple sugar transport system permease protein
MRSVEPPVASQLLTKRLGPLNCDNNLEGIPPMSSTTATPTSGAPPLQGDAPLMSAAELRKIGLRYRIRQSAIFVVVLFLLTQVFSIVYGAAQPDRFNYLSKPNIITAFEQIPLVGIAALGVGFLMIAGEFDLSIGANAIFSSIVMAQMAQDGHPVWLAALVGLLIGSGIGLLNGILTLALRIPSFITTLGTLGIWTAATLYFHGSASQTLVPTGVFRQVTSGQMGWIPAELIWFLLLGIGFYVLIQRTNIGNHVFASGGGRNAAVASGVKVVRAKLLAFTLTGTMAATSGILAASRIGSISPQTNTDLPLQAIAACVIGGVIITGGTGTVLGVMIGATLIFWIQDVLLLLAAPSYYLTAFVGALTIAAAWSYEMFRRRNP